jgi:hypothetical protein
MNKSTKNGQSRLVISFLAGALAGILAGCVFLLLEVLGDLRFGEGLTSTDFLIYAHRAPFCVLGGVVFGSVGGVIDLGIRRICPTITLIPRLLAWDAVGCAVVCAFCWMNLTGVGRLPLSELAIITPVTCVSCALFGAAMPLATRFVTRATQRLTRTHGRTSDDNGAQPTL